MPSGPWVSSAVRRGVLTGCSDPFDTGTPVILHSSSNARLLEQTCCTGTFPAVEAMPTSSASLLAKRYASAIASSTPVSTSMKTGSGVVDPSPPTVTPSRYGRDAVAACLNVAACLDSDSQPITQISSQGDGNDWSCRAFRGAVYRR